MSPNKIPLDLIQVASPCKASWEGMVGDEQTRFCDQCSQYVYNLSDLTEEQAEALVLEHEGKMCVRYYQRADGTVMTKDCPIGWKALKKQVALAGSIAVALFLMLFGFVTLGVFAGSTAGNGRGGRLPNPIQMVLDWLSPPVVAGGIRPAPVIPAPPQNAPAPLPADDFKK